MPWIDDGNCDALAGHCAAVAALVIALEDSGVLTRNSYRDALQRLWLAMAEDEAVGEAGAVIERMLDFLPAQANGNGVAADATAAQQVLPLAGGASKTAPLRGRRVRDLYPARQSTG